MNQLDRCKSIFVSWIWLIGILISLSIPIIAATWNLGSRTGKTETTLEILEDRTQSIQRIEHKIDTLLHRLDD